MKHTRNMGQLQAEMALAALADPDNLNPSFAGAETSLPEVDLKNPGLTRAQLEDKRWKVSAPVAEDIFRRLGLSLSGRASREIYAWPVIFKLEGVPDELARRASPETHADLFEDLIDAKTAALLLGTSQPHLRKQATAGQLPRCDIIRLGARGMYRFRTAQIEAEAHRRIAARLVGGTSRCAQ